MALVASNILTISVNYSIDMANQLTVTIIDPGFEMAINNYFQIGVDIVYETTQLRMEKVTGNKDIAVTARMRHIYEMVEVSVAQAGSASPIWTIQAMPKAIQQMKRDKTKKIGGSGYMYAYNVAKHFGLKFVGENSSKIKSPTKNAGANQADSVWTRLTSMASESQYVCFVADGTLYFATEKWLMYKWGTHKQEGNAKKDKNGKVIINKKTKLPEVEPAKYWIPMNYTNTDTYSKTFQVLSMPSLRKSENDPRHGEGTISVARDNGVQLRPGMTIKITNIPGFKGAFIITEVSFNEQTTEPVSVTFRTPEILKVNGKEPKIPMLPIGKIFDSKYFTTSVHVGESSIGLPIYNEISPTFESIGSTINPVGPKVAGKLPNSRRLDTYEYLANTLSDSKIPNYKTDFSELGNIDMWNRPVYVTGTRPKATVEMSRTFIYETTIETVPVWIIIERIWCNGGVPVLLSEADAITRYITSGPHHGILLSKKAAENFKLNLANIWNDLFMKRFPKSWELILKNEVTSIPSC